VFSDDQVAAIHEAALVILETQGMKVLSADARVLYRKAGAEIDEATLMVRLDRELVGASLKTAPRDITLHAVDPGRHVPLSNQCVAFAVTSGPPNIMDTAGGRRAGTFEISATWWRCARTSKSSMCRRRDRTAGYPRTIAIWK
jgi:trimethylamine--corrinoid protein Co-methyltransferase